MGAPETPVVGCYVVGWFKKDSSRGRTLTLRSPLARTDELVVEQVGDEVLIYDQRIHDAHCLSAAAGQVWRACDGKTPPQQLGAQLGLDRRTVERALEELDRCRLLDGGSESGMTRRQATRRFAKVGAAAAAAPLIYSIVSPVAAAAQSFEACFKLSGDCGTTGCKSVVGCCCCHNSTITACATDEEHCCVPATTCTSNSGTCSTTDSVISPAQSARSSPGTTGILSQPSTGGTGGAIGGAGGVTNGGSFSTGGGG